MKNYKYYIKNMYKYFYISQQILVITLILLTTGLGMLVPIIVKLIIDDVFTKQNYDKITFYGISLLIVILTLSIIEFFQNFFISKLGENISKKIRNDVYEKVLELDPQTLRMYNSSNIISLFNNDIAQINSLIVSFTTRFIVQIITLIVIFIVLLLIDVKLTLLSIFTIPVYFLFFSILKLKLRNYAKNRQELFVNLNKNLQEDIQGIEVIQSLKAVLSRTIKFRNLLEDMYDNNIKLYKVSSALGEIASLVAGLADVVVFWAGTLLIKNNQITVGSIFAFSVYIGRLYAPITSLISVNQIFQTALPSLKRVFNFLEKKSLVSEDEDAIEINNNIKKISLKNITLNYGKDLNSVDNVNMDFESGKVIGIVGESGSGKSSISRLLLRFIEPTSGDIFINNTHYRKYIIDSIRDHIGIVPQNTILFSGTIKDNIKFEMNNVEYYKIIESINSASVTFINDLSDGMDTKIGEGGFNISGGEKQRITIARTIIRDYDVLILDEATSSVDNSTRKKIIDNLLEEYKKKIIIIITHKLEDVKNADLLYVMNRGKVVGRGTHEYLLKKNSYYQDLYNIQNN